MISKWFSKIENHMMGALLKIDDDYVYKTEYICLEHKTTPYIITQ